MKHANHTHYCLYSYEFTIYCAIMKWLAQSAGAVEYTDGTSAEG